MLSVVVPNVFYAGVTIESILLSVIMLNVVILCQYIEYLAPPNIANKYKTRMEKSRDKYSSLFSASISDEEEEFSQIDNLFCRITFS